MTQREEFESAFKGYNLVRSKSDSSKYGDKVSQRMWEAYQEGFKAAKTQVVPQWIPVSERLPFDGEKVLIFDKGGTYGAIYTLQYYDDFILKHKYVTHWMPLPSAPEQQK